MSDLIPRNMSKEDKRTSKEDDRREVSILRDTSHGNHEFEFVYLRYVS